MKDALKSMGMLLGGLYLGVATVVFVPYFNWKYANEHGLFAWFMLGEVVSTAKAAVWPYFVFHTGHDSDVPTKGEATRLTVSEEARLSAVIAKADEGPYSASDLQEIRSLFREYASRTGSHLSQVELDSLLGGMRLAAEYQSELGASILHSWDNRQYSTTSRFDELLTQVRQQGVREPEKIQDDLRVLAAASLRQPYWEDEIHLKYALNREVILEGMQRAETSRENEEKLVSAVSEFVR